MCIIGMKYVTYWYQLFTRCEELVPVFHSVKFVKCEICGSTARLLRNVCTFLYFVYNSRAGIGINL